MAAQGECSAVAERSAASERDFSLVMWLSMGISLKLRKVTVTQQVRWLKMRSEDDLRAFLCQFYGCSNGLSTTKESPGLSLLLGSRRLPSSRLIFPDSIARLICERLASGKAAAKTLSALSEVPSGQRNRSSLIDRAGILDQFVNLPLIRGGFATFKIGNEKTILCQSTDFPG